MIDQFPLSTPNLDGPLQIDDDRAGDMPLDRAI
jgi:hypothetical protein